MLIICDFLIINLIVLCVLFLDHVIDETYVKFLDLGDLSRIWHAYTK